jgi:hypothetical protein
VTARDALGVRKECSLRVIVRVPTRGPASDPLARETGRRLLPKGTKEVPGYGLYSYLLLGSPPNRDIRGRYRAAVKAYWELMPAIADLESQIPRRGLNVTYLPVDRSEPLLGDSSFDWALDHYDYARARAILRTLAGEHRDGPYIISSSKPISVNDTLEGPYLYENLSGVPPELVYHWVKSFLRQAAQQRFWEEQAGQRLALLVRTVVAAAPLRLSPRLDDLAASIVWVPRN